MFATWLATQADRPDAVGRLAHLAADSQRFPPRAWRLYAFLHWAGDNEELRDVVKAAHREWRRVRKQAA
jgi:hypothetical protein